MTDTSFRSIVALLIASTCAACSETDPPEHEPEEIATIPDRPAQASSPDGPGATLAVTHYYLGGFTGDGDIAEKAYGLDRDNTITRADFRQHCQPQGGANPSSLADGYGGVDNGFEGVVNALQFNLAFSQAPVTNIEDIVNSYLGGRTSGLVFDLVGLGTQSDYDPMEAFVYTADLDAEGGWLLDDSSLNAPDAETLEEARASGKLHFTRSYVTEDVWVGVEDPENPVVLALTWETEMIRLDLKIHHPIVMMHLDPDRGAADGGIVSGILDTEEFLASIRNGVGSVDPSFCEGTAIEGLLNSFRQTSDIMIDGTQHPGEPCNGISIGFGFDASASTITGVTEPAPPEEPACAE